MASPDQARRKRETYLTLIGLFLGFFGAFTAWVRGHNKPLELRPLDVALLGLAAYRAGRLAAYDRVTAPLRAPFTETKSDASGAGEDVEAEGTGMRKAIGELVSCPDCVAVWAAALLVYGLQVAPGPTRRFLAILAAAGLAELLDSANEALTWSGKAERKQSAV